MILYRITSKAHIHDLSGTGAMLYGGRWNAKGNRMLYTSESLSLATLEIIANLSPDRLNRGFYCVGLNFPDHLKIATVGSLPKNWSTFPYKPNTVALGNRFIHDDGLCLKVPSAIIPSEYNYLLDPTHRNFSEIKFIDTRPFILDKRLIGRV